MPHLRRDPEGGGIFDRRAARRPRAERFRHADVRDGRGAVVHGIEQRIGAHAVCDQHQPSAASHHGGEVAVRSVQKFVQRLAVIAPLQALVQRRTLQHTGLRGVDEPLHRTAVGKSRPALSRFVFQADIVHDLKRVPDEKEVRYGRKNRPFRAMFQLFRGRFPPPGARFPQAASPEPARLAGRPRTATASPGHTHSAREFPGAAPPHRSAKRPDRRQKFRISFFFLNFGI